MQEKQQKMKENNMKNSKNKKNREDEMRPEYDFSDSIPNKYAMRLKKQNRLVSLEPDVYKVFHTSEQVNEVLRAIINTYPHNKRSTFKTV
jgi:hypothetical protein